MRSYRVINKYSVRDADGNPTGRYKNIDDIVSLDSAEAQRLMAAGCIIEAAEIKRGIDPVIGITETVETQTVTPPENRRRGRFRRR